ncbi:MULTISPECIES: hypothetical protein [unclassified Streptomyces]|uniref:hypothetical protein n=1 Tax=unclassified Streptomyces TaxID=2593676 RepID=UPI003D711469
MRLTALLLALPGAVAAPLLTAQPAAAATGGTLCVWSAADGAAPWSGGTSPGQIVPCEAGTTTAEEASDPPNPSLGAAGPVVDLDDALSQVWGDPELTDLQKILTVQYLRNNWAAAAGLEANARKALADAYAAAARGL